MRRHILVPVISEFAIIYQRDLRQYLFLTNRLARVAQAVKSRNSLPDCCCGYTLDQAVALENQVREWQDCLPAFLKISGDDETLIFNKRVRVEGTLTRLQAYELAIVSNVLVIQCVHAVLEHEWR
jgi:hypothetical protein